MSLLVTASGISRDFPLLSVTSHHWLANYIIAFVSSSFYWESISGGWGLLKSLVLPEEMHAWLKPLYKRLYPRPRSLP
jgi:hypothetical protein